jgi:hypothetical protein
MSIWFEDEPHIAELHEWFETLWAQSAPVEITDLQAFVGTLPHQSRASLGAKNGLPCRARPINSKLVSDKKPSLAVQETEAHLLLIQRVKQTPGREWMDCYFDLMKRVIEATGLTNDDRRLVISIPKASGECLPMSINNRWVLGAFKKNSEWGIRIIYGPEFEFLPELPTKVTRQIRFDPLPGEGFDTPFLLSLKDIDALLAGKWDMGWLSAAKAEVMRAQASPYRKYHQSVVYEAATNPTYRTQVFNAAFGER